MSNSSTPGHFVFVPSAYPHVTSAAIHQNQHGAKISCDASLNDPLLHRHVVETGSSEGFNGEIMCKAIVDVDVTLVQKASLRSSTHSALIGIGEAGNWLYVESVVLPPLAHITVDPRPSSGYAINYITQAMWALRKVIRGINDGALRINGELIDGLILSSCLSSDIGTVCMRKAMLEAGGKCVVPYANTATEPWSRIASVVGSATIVLRFKRDEK